MSEFYGDDIEFLTASQLREMTHSARDTRAASPDEIVGFLRRLANNPETISALRSHIKQQCNRGLWSASLPLPVEPRILHGMGLPKRVGRVYSWAECLYTYPREAECIKQILESVAEVKIVGISGQKWDLPSPGANLLMNVTWN